MIQEYARETMLCTMTSYKRRCFTPKQHTLISNVRVIARSGVGGVAKSGGGGWFKVEYSVSEDIIVKHAVPQFRPVH